MGQAPASAADSGTPVEWGVRRTTTDFETPLQLGNPVWAMDPNFGLNFHVRPFSQVPFGLVGGQERQLVHQHHHERELRRRGVIAVPGHGDMRATLGAGQSGGRG
jgi:hypothetical protein